MNHSPTLFYSDFYAMPNTRASYPKAVCFNNKKRVGIILSQKPELKLWIYPGNNPCQMRSAERKVRKVPFPNQTSLKSFVWFHSNKAHLLDFKGTPNITLTLVVQC